MHCILGRLIIGSIYPFMEFFLLFYLTTDEIIDKMSNSGCDAATICKVTTH